MKPTTTSLAARIAALEAERDARETAAVAAHIQRLEGIIRSKDATIQAKDETIAEYRRQLDQRR